MMSENKEPLCPWNFLDVLIFVFLTIVFVLNDPLNINFNTLQFLRLHFFIFTKEPKLLYCLTQYIGTIIFKIITLIFLIILIKVRKASFQETVLFPGKLPDFRGIWLPLYLVLCVVLCMVNISNPLIPNIPFNSVFIEAKLIGNMVILFSILFVAPFAEEIIFRGFLYPAFNKYIGIIPSIFLTSLIFTLAHYPTIKDEYLFAIAIFVLSVVITYARSKTGSTFMAVIMHHLYNLIYVIMGFLSYLILGY